MPNATVPLLSFNEGKTGGVGVNNEVIFSRQNRLVKLVCSLERKKAREESGLFRFDGIKLCLEALAKGIVPEYIFVCESRLCEIKARLGERDFIVVSDDVFSKMSEEKSPEGIITVAQRLDALHKTARLSENGEFDVFVENGEKVFLLEAIRDPGNLGTIIRTAASLGIDRIVMSADCADIYNPKTVRAAMGALFMLRTDVIEAGKTEEYIGALRASGRRVFAAALSENAVSVKELSVLSSDVFVIGNEGHGLSADTIDACDGAVIIPMKEGCESLNAAMATGILMWEISRA